MISSLNSKLSASCKSNFKSESFSIKAQPKIVYTQSGGTEKIFENLIVNQNEKL